VPRAQKSGFGDFFKFSRPTDLQQITVCARLAPDRLGLVREHASNGNCNN
jgi:hypothetical protein